MVLHLLYTARTENSFFAFSSVPLRISIRISSSSWNTTTVCRQIPPQLNRSDICVHHMRFSPWASSFTVDSALGGPKLLPSSRLSADRFVSCEIEKLQWALAISQKSLNNLTSVGIHNIPFVGSRNWYTWSNYMIMNSPDK